MSHRILVVYGSRHGSTRDVAETIADELRRDARAFVEPADDVVDIDAYDAVVVGAGISIGRIHRSARHFLERFRDELAERPLAIYALGPVKDSDSDRDSAREALDRALRKVRLTPAAKTVFGGAVDPAVLHFPFSHVPAADLRDWQRIRDWAQGLPEAFARGEELVADSH
jgi:menaquinone-dependent protoporphyrinogen oxidase